MMPDSAPWSANLGGMGPLGAGGRSLASTSGKGAWGACRASTGITRNRGFMATSTHEMQVRVKWLPSGASLFRIVGLGRLLDRQQDIGFLGFQQLVVDRQGETTEDAAPFDGPEDRSEERRVGKAGR